MSLDGLNLATDDSGRLVEVQCQDGLRLNGFLQLPTVALDSPLAPRSQDEPCNLWIIVHGVAGNFYSSSLLKSLAFAIRQRGAATLRVNTRGHDQIAFASSGALASLVGSAFESISECVIDLAAWTKFAHRAGFRRIGLLGHSLGAIKSAFFAIENAKSTDSAPQPEKLILISPPRLHQPSMLQDVRYGAGYRTDLALAEAALAAGEPDRLLQIRFPQPLTITASTFLDKYGSHSRYDYLAWAHSIDHASWIFGEREVRGIRQNFADCDRKLADLLADKPAHSIDVVSGAGHNYDGQRADLANLIVTKLDV